MALLEKPHRILFILAGIFLGISAVILAAPVIESYATQFSYGGEEEVAFPGRGSRAPDFELFTLAGNTVKLSDYHDLPVLINFWATWCGPCVLEMPLIEERHRRYSQELVVLGVNASESLATVEGFVDKLDLSFNILLDTYGKAQELYRVYAFPTTFLLDENGTVLVQHVGIMSPEQLDEYLWMAGVGDD